MSHGFLGDESGAGGIAIAGYRRPGPSHNIHLTGKLDKPKIISAIAMYFQALVLLVKGA